jgi:Ca-activated chloride channel homolog
MRSEYKSISGTAVLLITDLLLLILLGAVLLVGHDFLPGFRFERPLVAFGFVLLPLMTLAFSIGLARRNKRMAAIRSASIRSIVFPDISTTRETLKSLFGKLALASALVAAMGPKLGSKLVEVKTQGSDIMVALDVSHSMMAEDVSPNRLEASKRAISRLIDQLTGDRIGIVVFAGSAMIQLPITADYEAAKLFLGTISTDQIASQGTDIGAAIDLCPAAFDPESPAGRAIIIITDGEDHEEQGADAAARAASLGITVHTIGVGSDKGAPIPIYEGSIRSGRFKKDRDGNIVVTALDEASLINIADRGNGLFTRSSGSFVDLTEIMAAVRNLQKDEKEMTTYAEYDYYFRPFAWAALICLLLQVFITRRRESWSTALGILD